MSKAEDDTLNVDSFDDYQYNEDEWGLISYLLEFESSVEGALNNHSPIEICSYLYELAKLYNKFYHDNPILSAENEKTKNIRLLASKSTRIVLSIGLGLLGISPLDKM